MITVHRNLTLPYHSQVFYHPRPSGETLRSAQMTDSATETPHSQGLRFRFNLGIPIKSTNFV